MAEALSKDINIAQLQIVMQNLLQERISVRDLESILETLSTYFKNQQQHRLSDRTVQSKIIKKYLQTKFI